MITYQRFMIGARLKKSKFQSHSDADHEHCTMCGHKFSLGPNDLHEGYVTQDGAHWICPECLREFSDEYGWSAEN